MIINLMGLSIEKTNGWENRISKFNVLYFNPGHWLRFDLFTYYAY